MNEGEVLVETNKNCEGKRIGVIGAGGWGTALALLLVDSGAQVTLWSYTEEDAENINRLRENCNFLPGFTIPETITATQDLEMAVDAHDLILLAVPTPFMRGVLEKLKGILKPSMYIVNAAKGIENGTLLTGIEMMEEILPPDFHRRLCVISGPSFAREVAEKIPTAVVVASRLEETAKAMQFVFSTYYFRVFINTDVIGVEYGGALKNVLAIATGISDGLGLGTNTRAALITRGLIEIARLAVRKGANPLTLIGLSGLGDLILTCTGPLSRNRTVGYKIGRGSKLNAVLQSMKMVAEGVETTRSVHNLAEKLGVDVPIMDEVYRVLYEGKDPIQAVKDLTHIELGDEIRLL